MTAVLWEQGMGDWRSGVVRDSKLCLFWEEGESQRPLTPSSQVPRLAWWVLGNENWGNGVIEPYQAEFRVYS